MSSISELGCQGFLQNFDSQKKIERSAHGILENTSNAFKVAKHSVRWIFDLVSLTCILPLDYIPIFQAVKSVSSIVFESISVVQKGRKIHDNRKRIALCNRKIEKWTSRKTSITHTGSDKVRYIHCVQRKYERKLSRIDQNKSISPRVVSYRKQRMTGCLELINKIDSGSEEQLVKNFSSRIDNKIRSWEQEKAEIRAKVHKSLFGIITSLSKIALEAITLTSVVFSLIDGGSSFVVLKSCMGVGVYVLKLSKYLWWHSYIRDSKTVMGLRTFEHIAVAAVKYTPLLSISFIDSSLIRGLVGTCLSVRGIISNVYDIVDNSLLRNISDLKITKIQEAKNRILEIQKKIQEKEFEQYYSLKKKYEDKIANARENLRSLQQTEETSQCELIRSNIAKWKERFEKIDQAQYSDDSNEQMKVLDDILAQKEKKLNNWSKNIEFNRYQNNKVGAKIILKVVQIARFIFLAVAVSLVIAGVGANLLPGMIIAGVVANVAYLTYFLVNNHTERKLDKIREHWTSCPVYTRS